MKLTVISTYKLNDELSGRYEYFKNGRYITDVSNTDINYIDVKIQSDELFKIINKCLLKDKNNLSELRKSLKENLGYYKFLIREENYKKYNILDIRIFNCEYADIYRLIIHL
jgi:hypothetical protein